MQHKGGQRQYLWEGYYFLKVSGTYERWHIARTEASMLFQYKEIHRQLFHKRERNRVMLTNYISKENLFFGKLPHF